MCSSGSRRQRGGGLVEALRRQAVEAAGGWQLTTGSVGGVRPG